MGSGNSKSQYDNDVERVIVVSKELKRYLIVILQEQNPFKTYHYIPLSDLIVHAKPLFSHDVISIMQDLVKRRNKLVHEYGYDGFDSWDRRTFDEGFDKVSAVMKQKVRWMEASSANTTYHRNGEQLEYVVFRYKNLEHHLRLALHTTPGLYGMKLIEKTKHIAYFPFQTMTEMNDLRNSVVHDDDKYSITPRERIVFDSGYDRVRRAIDNGLERNQWRNSHVVGQTSHRGEQQHHTEEENQGLSFLQGLGIFALGAVAIAGVAMLNESERNAREEEEQRRRRM